jgi:hypothetical protein
MTLQSDNVIAAIDAARRDHERLISDHRKLPAATTLLEQRRRDFDQGAQYLAQVELRQVAENAWADLNGWKITDRIQRFLVYASPSKPDSVFNRSYGARDSELCEFGPCHGGRYFDHTLALTNGRWPAAIVSQPYHISDPLPRMWGKLPDAKGAASCL